MIWERYFFRETLKTFLFLLISFYLLYSLIDYSTHSHSFHRYRFTMMNILTFYGYEFITQMDTLIPFALLIATIRTLSLANIRREITALVVGGIKVKRILVPFLLLGALCTAFLYFNHEMLQPRTFGYKQYLNERRAKEKQKVRPPQVQQIDLNDGSQLVFYSYDSEKKELSNLYWIVSIDDIYYIRTLSLENTIPQGTSIEHLQRNAEGALILIESMETHAFETMPVNEKNLVEMATPLENLAPTQLRERLPFNKKALNEKETALLTTYYYKLMMPWTSILAILIPIPLCMRFTRSLATFTIYASSIACLVVFFLMMDAAVVLAERQVTPPLLALGIPFGAFFAIFGYRASRVR